MSRIIKFRVWDTKLQKMMSWNPFIRFDDSDYEVQQFTGLFDSAGKEIYEGDILELFSNKGVVVFEDTEDAAFEVIFMEDYLEGTRQGELMVCGENFFAPKSNIIGNVFENPELLSAV